ncbi:MAG: ggt 1 [Sphingomonas bacterium]|uniref:gamma-glutamyltransferase n=1 Tax=Sphingomonas bacterium TaxID=1895847 RepID=UPI0026091152|nr:gamma-glutamyltransferase [Sphingomonas bacterium]MDB5705913.1 ggt 1 [Sphingomonas bacterium]
MLIAKRLMALTVGLALMTSQSAAATSPQDWSAAERTRLEQREAAVWPTELRTVRGGKGLVSATASPIAVHAGVEALRQGGTAADAAVATALAQVTTMLGANVSFAGVAELVYFDAKTGKVNAMDAGWNGWRGETSPATIPDTDLSEITGKAGGISGAAGRKTLVPGFMAGMAAMHGRFGRLPFARLVAPSIWYAEHGVPVTPLTGAYFPMAAKKLARTPEGRRFAMPDGTHLPATGDRFVQGDLAATLKAVAAHGASALYRGAWARHFVAAVNAAGGRATMADMAAYKVRWTEPLQVGVAGATVYGPGAPNSTGCGMLTAINLLDHEEPVKPYWQDAQAFRKTALTLRLATILGWSPEVEALVGKQLGMSAGCASRLAPTFGAAAAGKVEALLDRAADPVPGHHSASVVVIDKWGNVAALVHSSNTPLWGDSGMVVDGVPIPVPAGLYRHELVRIAPGARVPTDMAPLIALRGGKPVLAAIGSSLLQETVRIVTGLIGDGDPATVMGAPPLLLNYEQLTGPVAGRDELVPVGRYPPAFLDQVRATGLPVREVETLRMWALRGTAVLGTIGPDGARSGEEVPQMLGFAEAE